VTVHFACTALPLPFHLSLPLACFLTALRTLFVHTECTVLLPFRNSNVMRSVRSSHLLLSSGISRPSSAKVSARSLMDGLPST
jgi:hypothetical protein